jgi:hypothetical protein
MMAGRYATVDELRSTARMVQILIEAGYDPSNDREMTIGATAYEAALLVCTYAPHTPPVRQAQKVQQARAGRNDPCPCGSGKKYKKCCIDLDRPALAADETGPLIKFGPDVVPRLWGDEEDDGGLSDDYDRLSEIICRDPAFASIGFAAEEVAAFVDSLANSEPALTEALKEDDPKTYDQAFDTICTRFLREHGRDFDQSAIKDKCLEAAKRATSNDEARALATGICLSLMSEMSDDPVDNPLATILFRKALFDDAGSLHIVDRMMGCLPSDADELCRLMEANDPSIDEKLKAAADKLSPSEVDVLRTSFDKLQKSLWDMIAAGKFPVPLPLATQMAMFGRLYVAVGSETPSRANITAAIETIPEDLIEEDYVQFGQMLDRWLKDNDRQPPDRIVEAVRTMRNLCAIRLIEDLVPVLFVSCLRGRQQAPFDADELKFIEGASHAADKPEFMTEYSAWLRMKGYPGMAERLLRCWNIDVAPQGNLQEAEHRIA